MIIWRGWGILILVIALATLAVTELVTEALLRDDVYYQAHDWPKAVGLWLAAVVVWPVGRYLNSRPGRILVEKETGEELKIDRRHELFFIKMELWAPILATIGIVVLLV